MPRSEKVYSDLMQELGQTMLNALPKAIDGIDPRKVLGAMMAQPRQMVESSMREAVFSIIRSLPPEAELPLVVSPYFESDMGTGFHGWSLRSDRADPVCFFPKQVGVDNPFEEGEISVSCAALCERAGEETCLSQHHGDILADRDMLSEAWRKFCFLLPGTTWVDPRGIIQVPCLHWVLSDWSMIPVVGRLITGKWLLHFHHRSERLDWADHRFLRIKQPA